MCKTWYLGTPVAFHQHKSNKIKYQQMGGKNFVNTALHCKSYIWVILSDLLCGKMNDNYLFIKHLTHQFWWSVYQLNKAKSVQSLPRNSSYALCGKKTIHFSTSYCWCCSEVLAPRLFIASISFGHQYDSIFSFKKQL